MAVVTMRQLLESGVHFGHQTRRWNPKMKRFIFTERNGIYIIDLRQTLDYIEKAFEGQYGSKPASSTIAAWCHFGNDRVAKTGKPAAYLFAPDGTDGEALAAKAAELLG